MVRVMHTKRQPLDIEIEGKENANLHLGPFGSEEATSRDLSDKEMESPQIVANLKAHNLVKVEAAPAEKPAKAKNKTHAAAAEPADGMTAADPQAEAGKGADRA